MQALLPTALLLFSLPACLCVGVQRIADEKSLARARASHENLVLMLTSKEASAHHLTIRPRHRPALPPTQQACTRLRMLRGERPYPRPNPRPTRAPLR